MAGCTALAAILIAGFPASPLTAKERKIVKSVSGKVLDDAENGIPGATVQLKDVQTGKALAAFAGEGGEYHFSDLLPTHDYELQAKFKGSSSAVRQVSSIDNRTRIVINLTIPKSKP